MEKELVSLTNICGGAIEEVFQRELSEVLENINDVNTNPEDKREISLKFKFKPFEDRSGAQITFECSSKTASVQPVKGTMFLQREGTRIVAVPHDPKQRRLFGAKAAAAGGGNGEDHTN